MKMFYCNVRDLSRSDGRCCQQKGAYITGSEVADYKKGISYSHSNKKDVLAYGIELPEGAPSELKNKDDLLNAMEDAEKQKNAVLAKEFILALPKGLTMTEWIIIILTYVKEFTSRGFLVLWALHGKKPH